MVITLKKLPRYVCVAIVVHKQIKIKQNKIRALIDNTSCCGTSARGIYLHISYTIEKWMEQNT